MSNLISLTNIKRHYDVGGEVVRALDGLDLKIDNNVLIGPKSYVVKSIKSKVIEVHISNTFSRESFRHKSFLSPVVDGIIVGFGLDSYRLAVESLIEKNKN